MSTKTLRKRIALVAVSALGAGLLSVVAVPSANAVGNNALATATTNPAIAAADTLYQAVAASTTGSGVAIATSTTAIASTPDVSAGKSLGLINVGDIAGNTTPIAGTTQTAILLSSGSLSVYTSNASGTHAAIVVTGGTISSSTGTYLNGGATIAASGASGAVTNWGVVARPSSGATTMTIQLYTGYAYATSVAASNAAVAANPSALTLSGQITVSIASASTAGIAAAAKSGAYFVAHGTTAVTADATGYTGTGSYGTKIYLSARVRDTYGTAITTSGLLSVAATGGAKVLLNGGSGVAGTQSADYEVTTSPDQTQITVSNPTAAPLATTVTVSWNGTVISTRTVGFSGEVAKVVLSAPMIGKTGGSANLATYKLYDAAGNATYVDYNGGTANTDTPEGGLIGGDYAGAATAVTRDADWSLNTTTGVATAGKVAFTCSSTAGTGTIAMTYTNNSGSIVTSNTLPVSCAGDAVSYKASYDKTTYKPGDIATLTVQFYDAKGNKANDITAVEGASSRITISTAGMSQSISVPDTDTVTTGVGAGDIDQGALVYSYSVDTNEGTFTNKIDAPTINPAGAAYLTTATTATLTVALSSTAVSMADVLKAIVSLIASINKQIAALQKALLKK